MIPPRRAIVETERLIISPFQTSDAAAMIQVFGDPEVMRFGSGVQTREWVETWLLNCLADYRRRAGIGPWAVIRKDCRRVIGYCGFFYFPDVCGQPETEIGYRLARLHWGRGYATEAARAVLHYGFDVLGLSRLIAIIDPSNVRSIRVAEKLGMYCEKEVMFEGYTHPDRVYVVARPKLRTSTSLPRGGGGL